MDDGPARTVCKICRDELEPCCKSFKKAVEKFKGYIKNHEITAGAVLTNSEVPTNSFNKEKGELQKAHESFQNEFKNLLTSYIYIEHVFSEKSFNPQDIISGIPQKTKESIVSEYGEKK